jgi:hypothetical protein
LRLLVIVNYPQEFGGLAKGAHKLDIFVPVEKVLSEYRVNIERVLSEYRVSIE